ncbi:MAG: tetratricopeptide repeat protein [Minicystis sp.]
MTDGQHSGARGSRARHKAAALLASVALSGRVGLVGLVSVTPACVHGPASPGDEQRSTGEYDLAGDAFKNRKLREALDHIQKALKLNPDNADAAYLGATVMLAFCALDDKSPDCRLKEAEDYARRALAAAPEHRDAKNALGVILVHEGRYDEAIAILKPLTEDLVYASPESAWGNLGWAYFQRGSTDEALDAFRRAVAVQPLFCVGQYRLGLAYEKKGDLAAAREAFTKAVETDQPQCKRLQDAFSARARVLSRQGLKTEARADLERCRDLSRDTPVGQKCAAQLQTYQ